VQQHGHVEHLARQHLVDDLVRKRMLVAIVAALDARQMADRADQMLVDRIVVIHVELHLRDDAPEVRNEGAEHAGLVHQPERALRVAARTQDFDEKPVRLLVDAQRVVDQPDVARDVLERVGMHVDALLVGEMEQPEKVDRMGV
jgi:hypothetical protein